MKKLFLICILVLSILSCHKTTIDDTFIFTIENRDFEDFLTTSGTVEAVNSVGLSCPRNVEGKVIYLIKDGQFVHAGDTVCLIEDQNLQNRYENAVSDLERTQAQYRKTEADLALQYSILESQVKANEAETEIARLDSAQLKFLTPNQLKIKLLELERVEIEKKKLSKKLNALKRIQQSELRRLQLRLKSMENNIQKFEELINTLTVVATIDGLAIRADSWSTGNKLREGDVVWGNMPLIMIPNLDKMKVKIWAPEAHYKRIELGDSLSYSFDALPNNRAFGKIISKSPVGTPIKRDSKVKFFEMVASVDSTIQIPEPGLSANCKIYLKHITDTIVIPRVAVFEIDSVNYAFVLSKNKFIQKELKLGPTTLKEIVVEKGLTRGDKISLIKPEKGLIHKTILLKDSMTKKATL